jgi:hypothetical protein
MRVENTKLVIEPDAGRNGRLVKLVYQFNNYTVHFEILGGLPSSTRGVENHI